ncbi:MAG: hypothetical protein EXR28_14965 [Betaproteobacteria bacterium]|nr:hypothetical protein [Betaproteobacteria bacterium]
MNTGKMGALANFNVRALCRVAVLLVGTSGLCGGLFAQIADIGLVNQLSGEVAIAGDGGAAMRATPFMKIRAGDRFTVPAGASIRMIYFKSNRQETWRGPASFRVGGAQSEATSGNVEVSELPALVTLKMSRVPDLMLGARLGGVTLRGGKALPRGRPNAEERAEIARAQATYQTLRARAPEDDIAPELYLSSVLQEYGQYQDMKPLVEAMQKRLPGNTELRDLAAAVEKWAASQQ